MTQSSPASESPDSTKSPYQAGPNAVDISPNKDQGVLKEIIKPGDDSETPCQGCQVTVHYVGTLTDGTKFDSSVDRNEPFEFSLGKGSVIKAWDIGVATMKKNEVAVFTCKPEYAYGENGSPPKIGPNATLIFEITCINWTGEDLSPKKDNGIVRYQITKGDGFSTPNEFSTVEAELIGSYNKNIFDQRTVSFTLGEGSEQDICEGVEKALEKFKKNEKSLIVIKPKYAFKETGHEKFNIPPNATIDYVLELKNFEKSKESWSLDSPGKLEQAKFFKERGTNFFKATKYNLALKMYKKMITFLEFDTGFEGEEETERKSLLLIGHLNTAMCYLKNEEHIEARDACDKAIGLDSSCEKGFFRRGLAYLGMCEPEFAKTDFEAVLKLEPNNKAAANQIVICNGKLNEIKKKEKKIYANMFEKFAQRDREVGH